MWDDAGIIRNRDSLDRTLVGLDNLESELAASGLLGQERVFNLSWHDWLNLDSLMLVSRAITLSAIARENSRGAHFRDDFPGPGDLATSAYTVMNLKDGEMEVKTRPVDFVRVRPGESLVDDAA